MSSEEEDEDEEEKRGVVAPPAENWTVVNIRHTVSLQHSCSGMSRTWAASCAAGPADTTPSLCPRCWLCRGGGRRTSTSS